MNVTQNNGLIFDNASDIYNVFLNRTFTGNVISYIYVSAFSGSQNVALVYKDNSGTQSYITTTSTGIWSLSNDTSDSTLRLVQNGNNIGYEKISWWFVIPDITMPTFTIGIGNSITISNQPTYQQLLTITNPSQYGINKAGSNIQFTASNGTFLYAWIQSINSTSMQIWVKNFAGNSVVDMQVLPSFENLFNANGYLGEKLLICGLVGNCD